MHGSHLRDSNLISMWLGSFKVPQMILHETQDRDSAASLDIVGVRSSGVSKSPENLVFIKHRFYQVFSFVFNHVLKPAMKSSEHGNIERVLKENLVYSSVIRSSLHPSITITADIYCLLSGTLRAISSLSHFAFTVKSWGSLFTL